MVSHSAPKINRNAQALARLLGPSPSSEKVGSGDLMQVKKRLVSILNLLEKTKKSNGPSPQDLLVKAYGFRKDIGQHESMVTAASLIANWELARAVGLFTGEGQYTDRIVNGRDSGEKIAIEHIVLPEKLPRFSAHLANVRLIEPSKKRKKDAGMSPRDAAYEKRLVAITDERKGMVGLDDIRNRPKGNALGQSKDQSKRLFEGEMKIAGDRAKEMPKIRLSGKMTASPSSLSKGRWRVSAEITNSSLHPTSIELEWYMIGITEKKNQHYVMAKGKQPLKLRRGQIVKVDFHSSVKNSYKNQADDVDGLSKKERQRSRVRYRGYVLRVNHEKGVVGVSASDRTMMLYINGEGSTGVSGLPDFSKPSQKQNEYQ